MANSKSDEKAPKTMDIMQPGTAMPPASARPVIVTNRPLLRQDPMMVSPDGMEKPEELVPRPSVSRVGRTLTVLAPHQAKTAKAATLVPLSSAAADTNIGPDVTLEPASSSEALTAPVLPQGRTPAEIVGKKAITVKIDEPAPSGSTPTDQASSRPAVPAMPTSELVAAPSRPAEQPKPVASAMQDVVSKPASSTPPSPLATQASAPAPVSSAPLSTEDDISADSDPGDASAAPGRADSQLAPNKTFADAKKKVDDAEAARVAEQERIIATRQYYLPIKNTEARRGVSRSLMVLLLVLILTVVWFDIVLDAGILHVGNMQSLTHFFK